MEPGHSLQAVAIVGPTASGKSATAIELVDLLGGDAEIVSVDSVQVYKELNIGSAKPTQLECNLVQFHAIDLVDPDQDFTVADYQEIACDAVREIQSRGRRPILCGGTGLYFKALTSPMGIPHVAPDDDLRAAWMEYLDQNGPGSLHAVLMQRDPDSALRLHVNDARRIIRALEVLEKTGTMLSTWHSKDASSGQALISDCAIFGVERERNWLNERINRRVDDMIDNGFAAEVKSLRQKGYNEKLKSMQSLGYKELSASLNGQMSIDDAVDQVKLHTRQYAKRQMIWFRADKRITWLGNKQQSPAEIAAEIGSMLNLQTSVS